MEKIAYDIVFGLKNNPSEPLREINKLLTDIQCNTEQMSATMSQQLSAMKSPIDEVRNSWLNLTGDAGAYFAVMAENLNGVISLIEIKKHLDNIGATTKIGSAIQSAYNKVIAIGGNALSTYQTRVVAANLAISTTTGATKALNMLIAASPYLIAAAAATALAVGIYKIATSSNQNAEAQKRLSTTFVEMNVEVAKERIALDGLFAPLNRAKVGSEEWKKAKDNILAQYGPYLNEMGVEITSADTARVAYTKLSQAIIETARARASEKATSGASENYADAEGNTLKNIRQQLYSGIGQGVGKITATQAGKAWAQIREAVLSGKDIPQEAQEILKQTQTSYTDQTGTHFSNPIADYVYQQVKEMQKARSVYEQEIASINAIYGKNSKHVLDNNGASVNTNTNTITNPLAASPPPSNNYAGSSLAAYEARLSELQEKQKNAPFETQLSFTLDIVQIEQAIADTKARLEKAVFEAKYTLKPTQEDAPRASALEYAKKSSLDKGGALDNFKIPEMDIEQPLSSMERWNAALDSSNAKNASTIQGLNVMGGAMGTLGNAVGGSAGAWMEWAGNLMGAIAQALPQLAALSTANTVTAATGAASSVASIPWVGPVLAIAAVASILGALASLPKFANGGIAYGPTLGLFGEYAGASNNPEVVAPLNKLRQLIQPAGDGGMGGRVEFIIDGRNLRGVLNKIDNFNRRTV